MMKKYLVAVLTVALLLTCMGCSTTDETKPAPDAIIVGTEETDIFKVETQYVTLKYPSRWEDTTAVSVTDGDVTRVEFKVKGTDVVLFDILFGGNTGYLLGTLTEENGVDVRIESYPLPEDDENYSTYCEMQEDVNVIINHLYADYEFVLNQGTVVETPAEQWDGSVYEIETPYALLKYPARWQEAVTVTVAEETVTFTVTDTDIALFDLIFGESEDYLLGTLKTESGEIAVRIKPYDLDASDEDFNIYCGMQEDVNVIIENLITDYDFAINA